MKNWDGGGKNKEVTIIGCCCQGPVQMSKKGNLWVSNEKINEK